MSQQSLGRQTAGSAPLPAAVRFPDWSCGTQRTGSPHSKVTSLTTWQMILFFVYLKYVSCFTILKAFLQEEARGHRAVVRVGVSVGVSYVRVWGSDVPGPPGKPFVGVLRPFALGPSSHPPWIPVADVKINDQMTNQFIVTLLRGQSVPRAGRTARNGGNSIPGATSRPNNTSCWCLVGPGAKTPDLGWANQILFPGGGGAGCQAPGSEGYTPHPWDPPSQPRNPAGFTFPWAPRYYDSYSSFSPPSFHIREF